MSTITEHPAPTMSIREAAETYKVSPDTIRRRIAEGALPAYRHGPRLIRLVPEDVAALFRPIPTAGGGRVAG